MKIAILTEGDSEFKSMPLIYDQLKTRTRNTFLAPLKINVPPDASPGIIARECRPRLLIAKAKGAHKALILLDREQVTTCPGEIASALQKAIEITSPSIHVLVVLKDRAYENWLLADLEALKKHPQRFSVSPAIRRKISPNKADRCDGLSVIKTAVSNGQYDKKDDSVRIMRHLSIVRAAQNSRSFRHFLHVAGDPDYKTQCKNPSSFCA